MRLGLQEITASKSATLMFLISSSNIDCDLKKCIGFNALL
jgi:hypothetical protein